MVPTDKLYHIITFNKDDVEFGDPIPKDDYIAAWSQIGNFRFDDRDYLWIKMEAALNQLHNELYHFSGQNNFFTSDSMVTINTMETDDIKRFRNKQGYVGILLHSTRFKCLALCHHVQRITNQSSRDCCYRLLKSLAEHPICPPVGLASPCSLLSNMQIRVTCS